MYNMLLIILLCLGYLVLILWEIFNIKLLVYPGKNIKYFKLFLWFILGLVYLLLINGISHLQSIDLRELVFSPVKPCGDIYNCIERTSIIEDVINILRLIFYFILLLLPVLSLFVVVVQVVFKKHERLSKTIRLFGITVTCFLLYYSIMMFSSPLVVPHFDFLLWITFI
jgi:hypothetical protein